MQRLLITAWLALSLDYGLRKPDGRPLLPHAGVLKKIESAFARGHQSIEQSNTNRNSQTHPVGPFAHEAESQLGQNGFETTGWSLNLSRNSVYTAGQFRLEKPWLTVMPNVSHRDLDLRNI